VVAATRSLVATEDLDAVTLRRVATELGVTAPALYAHVRDKRDLLRAVAEGEFEALLARFDAVGVEAPLDRVRALSRAYVAHALEQPALFRTMFLFAPDLSFGAPPSETLAIAGRAFELGVAAVADAVDAGLLPSQDVARAGLVLWTATHGVADVLLLGFGDDDHDRAALLDEVLDAVLAGLGARGGRGQDDA
jgi:AcrR family transcriptional regulator